MNYDAIIEEVKAEIARATKTFGKFNSMHEGYAVILEELDELWDAIKSNQDHSRIRQEAIQVAAMTFRFLHDLLEE